MSINTNFLKMTTLFKNDADLETIIAAAITRMTDFSALCEEKNRIDAGVIDSDLELSTPQAKRLNEIRDVLDTYPVDLNPAYPDTLSATVGMLVNDRDLPVSVTLELAFVVAAIAKKNNLALTAEPNVAAHVYDWDGLRKTMEENIAAGNIHDFSHIQATAPNRFAATGTAMPPLSALNLPENFDPEMFKEPLTGAEAVYDLDAVRSMTPSKMDGSGGVPNVVTDNIIYEKLEKLPTPMSGAHMSSAMDVSALHTSLTAQARAAQGYDLCAEKILAITPSATEAGVAIPRDGLDPSILQLQTLNPFDTYGGGPRSEMFRRTTPLNIYGDESGYKPAPELLEGNGPSETTGD